MEKVNGEAEGKTTPRSGLRKDADLVFTELKRAVKEKIVYNYKVRDPVLVVGGLGLFVFGGTDANVAIQNASMASGSAMFLLGCLDFALEVG